MSKTGTPPRNPATSVPPCEAAFERMSSSARLSDDELVWNAKTKKYYRHGSCWQESHSVPRADLVEGPGKQHGAEPYAEHVAAGEAGPSGPHVTFSAAELTKALAALEAGTTDIEPSTSAALVDRLRAEHDLRLQKERESRPMGTAASSARTAFPFKFSQSRMRRSKRPEAETPASADDDDDNDPYAV